MAIYLTPDKISMHNGLLIKEFFLTTHNPNEILLPSKRIKSLIGVTMHNTPWIIVNAATTPAEQYTRATYNGNMGNVAVHYYTDNVCAWQNLPLDYKSWHAGQKGKADAHGSDAGNGQTISIECIMDGTNASYNAKSRDNAARLAAYLLYTNGFTVHNLYTHNYWCNIRNGKTGTVDQLNKLNDGYKNCPVYIRPQWEDFKKLVDGYIIKLGGKSVYSENTSDTVASAPVESDVPYKIEVIDSELNVRKGAGVNYSIVTTIKKNEVYTIVEEKTVINSNNSKSVWGRLKSGAGWINVGSLYVKKY